MKTVSSYGIEIKNMNKIFRPTVQIYNKAVTFCIENLDKEWNNLKPLTAKKRLNYAERLLHSTGNRQAKYDFDTQFYKMPSYMRRSVVSLALGYLSSYHSNVDNWYANDCKGKKPTFQKHLNQFPTFYRGNSYTDTNSDDSVNLKLYIDNDWKFVKINLKHTDVKYIYKHCQEMKMSCPTLEKKYHKWFLRFVFEKEVSLSNKKEKILSVDLGINTDATCSVMLKDGTILARKSINFASDKDYLYHTLNKIKGISQKYGSHNTTKLWRVAKFKNEELARKIAKAITDFAVEQNVDVIVFEYLDMKGKKHGSKKQKLHMWKKNSIQRKVENKAHRNSIRISRICACGTSKLAYDGSGKVIRGKEADLPTYSLCKFVTGKIYNCDLSASYNVGARYFIRDIEKSISAKKWSAIQTKVPSSQKRTLNTYNTLIEILKIL